MKTIEDEVFRNLSVINRENSVVIRFTQIENKCPLSTETLGEIDRVISGLSSLQEIRKIIFTGTENVFASGANLNEIASLGSDTAREFALRGQNLFQLIALLPQTTIAAINGICFGGALDLALACKFRVASPSATFCHPGIGLGIITGWGGTQRLPRMIGESLAMEILLTAERFSAQDALRFGLINEISDEVLQCALEITF